MPETLDAKMQEARRWELYYHSTRNSPTYGLIFSCSTLYTTAVSIFLWNPLAHSRDVVVLAAPFFPVYLLD